MGRVARCCVYAGEPSMSLENQQRQERNLIKEMNRQERCGSCGKKWDTKDCIEEELCNLANRGFFSKDNEVKALGIIFDKLAGEGLI